MQLRRGATAPTGLNQRPDLAGDNADEQKDGAGVDQQECDDDPMGRLDRREADQNHEGQERRQQREADRDRRQQPAQSPAARLGE